MRTYRLCLLGGFLLLASAPAAGAPSPTVVLKRSNAKVDRLLKKKVAKGSPQEKKLQESIRKIVGALIDYDELAQKTMSRHWSDLTPPQQAEFTGVFRQLIERNYVRQIRGGLDYGVTYKGEKVKGDRARVTTVVRAKRKGRVADTVVEYKMLKKAGDWRVYDIITDEDEYSSLVVNYRSQFNKIWSKDGFEGLLKKMRKKLKEVGE